MTLVGKKHFRVINHPVTRVDAVDKVTGRAKYAADLVLPDMLVGGCLRSKLAHADIVNIDVSKARDLPGVHAVLTASDVANPQSWADYYYLAEKVRYVGDVVAIVAAENKDILQDALDSIVVEYHELEGVFTIEEALKDDAPVIRKEKGVALVDGVPTKGTQGNVFYGSYFPIRKGDVEEGFSRADIIVERAYDTPYIEHSYIEPEACLVYEDQADGIMTAHASAQNPFFTRRYLMDALGAPMNQCRVVQRTLGGSFGGKEELVGLIVGRAAMLARATHRPVKMTMTREDSFLESSKRHPYHFTYKAGLSKEGKILAWEGTQVANSGAYNNQTQFMNWRASVHSAGVYNIPHVKTDTYGVYTNNIHGGAMRGYSSPQLIFAQEQFINELAAAVGLDPVKFRLLNVLQRGDMTATGQKLVEETITVEMIEHMVQSTNYYAKKEAYEKTQRSRIRRKGIGMATCFRGCGYGAETPDAGAAMCTAMEDGTIIINSGLAENGQGLKTAYVQIAAEGIGCSPQRIHFIGTDTHAIPDSGMTVASRGTVMGAQSMKKASIKLGRMLRETAAEILDVDIDDVGILDDEYFIKPEREGDFELYTAQSEFVRVAVEENGYVIKGNNNIKDFGKKVSLKEVCNARLWTGKPLAVFEWHEPRALVQDHHTGQGNAFPTYAYGCVVAEVEVDMETGYVDVLHVVSGHDVGTCVNPDTVNGQIYGGIAMGQGFCVTEKVNVNQGQVGTTNFDSYIFPTSMDVPVMESVIFECDDKEGTYGAKSLGEPATEAVAAAIAGAIGHAIGRPIRELPCNLERMLLGEDLK